MKKRNPPWGCPQIAGQIKLALGASINKDVFAGFSPYTTDRNRELTVRHG